MRMRWSRLGLSLAGMYAMATAALVVAALWDAGPGDPTGRFVLLQLPIALQLAALPDSLLRRWGGFSWSIAYLLVWLPTVLLLYAAGHAAGHATGRLFRARP